MALPATDNFNRSNGAIGANWTALGNASSNPGFLVQANACKANTSPGGGVSAFAVWNADTFGDDHFAEATFASSGNMGLCVRMRDNGSARADGYVWRFNNGTISRVNGGTLTALTTGLSVPAVGSICRLTVSGSGLVPLDDGVALGLVTDSTFTTGGAPGIFGTSGNAGTLDDWQGDNVSAATTSLTPPLRLMRPQFYSRRRS